jgi:hypothetical protein
MIAATSKKHEVPPAILPAEPEDSDCSAVITSEFGWSALTISFRRRIDFAAAAPRNGAASRRR